MDLTATKQQFAEDMVALAKETLLLAQKLDYLKQSYSAHKFDAGATAFQDSDFQTSNQQLTAKIVQDVMFALNNISNDIDLGTRNSLLECIPGGLP